MENTVTSPSKFLQVDLGNDIFTFNERSFAWPKQVPRAQSLDTEGKLLEPPTPLRDRVLTTKWLLVLVSTNLLVPYVMASGPKLWLSKYPAPS